MAPAHRTPASIFGDPHGTMGQSVGQVEHQYCRASSPKRRPPGSPQGTAREMRALTSEVHWGKMSQANGLWATAKFQDDRTFRLPRCRAECQAWDLTARFRFRFLALGWPSEGLSTILWGPNLRVQTQRVCKACRAAPACDLAC